MDDKQRETVSALRTERKEKEEKQKQKKDYFTSVTICQTVICIFLFFVMFFTTRADTEGSRALKEDYRNLMNWSLENTDSESVVKTISEFLKEPVNLMPAFLPLDETENTTEETENSETEITEETVETEETSSALKDESEENPETENMGGEDVESYEAADNATFSPVATTCKAVAPVNSTNYTSYFGYRVSPITNEESFHTGLDIAAPMGDEVYASYRGTVRKTGEDSRSGKYVIITHSENFETFYCHLSKILTKEGDEVLQGEKIALVGSTGWSTGPHLHFEIRSDGKRVDPLTVLENGV